MKFSTIALTLAAAMFLLASPPSHADSNQNCYNHPNDHSNYCYCYRHPKECNSQWRGHHPDWNHRPDWNHGANLNHGSNGEYYNSNHAGHDQAHYNQIAGYNDNNKHHGEPEHNEQHHAPPANTGGNGQNHNDGNHSNPH